MSQTTTDAPAPAPADAAAKGWVPPSSDEEFVFQNVSSAPAWVDKNWASFDRGPALAVPMGNLDGTGPYHTAYARPGDTVKFVAAKGATAAHMVIIPGEPVSTGGKKLPQASAASLEDMLRNGMLTPDDLGDDAKAQVASRTPGLAAMIESGAGAPAEPMSVADVLKTS